MRETNNRSRKNIVRGISHQAVRCFTIAARRAMLTSSQSNYHEKLAPLFFSRRVGHILPDPAAGLRGRPVQRSDRLEHRA
jgi:hypothetical protein